MLISVIIPVYNIEKYIAKCVNSIIEQTYEDIEIILVDDGSRDASGKICDDLSKQDERIQVIHKKNGGQTSARNAGVQVAKGDYIFFVDGDDWIDKQMIEELASLLQDEEIDIVTSGCVIEDGESKAKIMDSLKEGVYASDIEKEYFYRHMIYNGSVDKCGMLRSVCGKLISASIVREVLNKQSNLIKYGEDMATILVCCMQARKILVTHKIYYHYIRRDGSMTHSLHMHYLTELNEWYICLKTNAEKYGCYNLIKKQVEVYMIESMLFGINTYMGLEEENQIPYYFFDEKRLSPNIRLVLYGAGKVGRSFYKQIKSKGNYQLVSWVDRDYWKYQKSEMKIESVDALAEKEYDVILVAINYESMAKTIKETLINKGIPEKKIVWIKPENIIDKYIKL